MHDYKTKQLVAPRVDIKPKKSLLRAAISQNVADQFPRLMLTEVIIDLVLILPSPQVGLLTKMMLRVNSAKSPFLLPLEYPKRQGRFPLQCLPTANMKQNNVKKEIPGTKLGKL